jgi:hypothetical protein
MAPLRDVTAKQLGLRTDARASGAPGDIILNGDVHNVTCWYCTVCINCV